MKEIIALYGSSSKGKTTTLNKLIDLLKIISDISEIKQDSKDSYAYFEIYNKKIVVCTKGDYGYILQENISFATEHDYDIFVTATRTKGYTVSETIDFKNSENANLYWIPKEDNEPKNNLIAAELLSLIVKHIDPDFESTIQQ